MSIRLGTLHQLKEHSSTHPLTYPLICKHSLYLSRTRKNLRTREKGIERGLKEERRKKKRSISTFPWTPSTSST
jgi:hypothetical protein